MSLHNAAVSVFRPTCFFLIISLATASLAVCESGDQRLHDSFDISSQELSLLIETLPENLRRGIESRSWYFLELIDQVLAESHEYILLVDKANALESEYLPDDLVQLKNYSFLLNRSTLSVREPIIPDLLAMVESARIAGIGLPISSAFRSYEYQAEVYARNVAQQGEALAKRESAEPGKSQHQLGTTIDFGSITDAFGDTDAGRWLLTNAWRFGFSLSYPNGYEALTGYRHEIWHYRYVGRSAALLEREFFGSIQQYMLEFLHENGTALGNRTVGTE